MVFARAEFSQKEKLCFCWRGPRRVIKALKHYSFRDQNLGSGGYINMHGSRLRLYRNADLDEKAIMPPMLPSETGMPVARLFRVVDQNGEIFVVIY